MGRGYTGVELAKAAAIVTFGAGTLLLAAALVRGIGEEPVRAVLAPELRSAPEALADGSGAASRERAREVREGFRIGSFARPEEVPGYEILESRRDDRDGARILRLLVDTGAGDEPGFAAIAQDIKARYPDHDLISVEFTDSTTLLDYNGSALIFNTPEGAALTGYFYGPPNNRGFLVRAAD